MSKKRNIDEYPIILSEQPWKVFNILKNIQENRTEDKHNPLYSASELYILFVTVLRYWKKGIDKSIEIINKLHEYIEYIEGSSTEIKPLNITESREENRNNHIEYLKVYPEVINIARSQNKLQDIRVKISKINNFLNNLDIYITTNVGNHKENMQKLKKSIYKKFLNKLKRYELLIKEKHYLENISWIINGQEMIPKRIKTITNQPGIHNITMNIIRNGNVVGNQTIELPNNEKVFKNFGEDLYHSNVTDFDSGEESDEDDEDDGDDEDEHIGQMIFQINEQLQQHAGKKPTRKRNKNKVRKSKMKKTKSKKSSKSKKRNLKIYHNAHTKTNRKKRVS